MGIRHEQYAQKLQEVHGIDKAVYMVKGAIMRTEQGAHNLTYFDEADFHVDDRGRYQFNKQQSDKGPKAKQKRITKTLNFYKEVLKLLTRNKK